MLLLSLLSNFNFLESQPQPRSHCSKRGSRNSINTQHRTKHKCILKQKDLFLSIPKLITSKLSIISIFIIYNLTLSAVFFCWNVVNCQPVRSLQPHHHSFGYRSHRLHLIRAQRQNEWKKIKRRERRSGYEEKTNSTNNIMWEQNHLSVCCWSEQSKKPLIYVYLQMDCNCNWAKRCANHDAYLVTVSRRNQCNLFWWLDT